MAKLIVKINIDGVRADQLRADIAAARTDPEGTNSWVSRADGLNNVLVDEAMLVRSRDDDSFFVFDYVAVEE